jgi:hypothetical protein
VRTFTMSLTNADHGTGNPATMGFTMSDMELAPLVVARLVAFVSSLVAGNMGSTIIQGIQMRVDGQIGITDVPFPVGEYANVKAWPEPSPVVGGLADPPALTAFGTTIIGITGGPLGTSALITERVGTLDQNGATVGPGNNGRLYLPFIGANAFTNGILSANTQTAIKKAYEWYVLAEGNPNVAERPTSRPWIHGRVPGSPPGSPLVYRQVTAVAVRPRASHLRSRSR